jgi:CRISPR-associated helicase Cas3/CRISPR-associated endonuclease Cas3-HD
LYYARSDDFLEKDCWQTAKDHLTAVADMAASFASEFQGAEMARCIGLLHDAGKYSAAFQWRLEGGPRTDHSTAGAKIADEKYPGLGRIMAYCICGHHGGMPDGVDSGYGAERTSLTDRLKSNSGNFDAEAFFQEIDLPDQIMEYLTLTDTTLGGFRLAFYTRMLFSALVDADCLDAHRWKDPESARIRANWPALDQLISPFFEKMTELQSKAIGESQGDAGRERVNKQRMLVYRDCLKAAECPQGMYTLTVPTGGGKTLSSMAFALVHARKHRLKRVIYVIPYTSIIEQNAAVFRRFLGEGAVLEHHSNYNIHSRVTDGTPLDDKLELAERLASENYDAPVVVTTSIQFFESLFANKTSKCRKLHNFANSVIILDEVQTLPDQYLKPCVEALRCLCSNYNATIVLCTATQPALDFLYEDDIKEIIEDPQGLYESMRKVDVVMLGTLSDDALVERLLSHPQVLCIVNTRKHARNLFDMLPQEDGTFHLSALMCPEHRSEILTNIRERLDGGLPCRVISTQLIEAGVDIDLPVVYRSAAGIDSIAQAAGRCNREGKLPMGQAYIFMPEDGLPGGHFLHAAQLGIDILSSGLDPLGLEAVKCFFTKRYRDRGDDKTALDKNGIVPAFDEGLKSLSFPFERVAREFTLIESPGISVVIPFDTNCRRIIDKVIYSRHPWKYARTLQRYTVQVYPHEHDQLCEMGVIKSISGIYEVLSVDKATFPKVYHQQTGLRLDFEMEGIFQ